MRGTGKYPYLSVLVAAEYRVMFQNSPSDNFSDLYLVVSVQILLRTHTILRCIL
jgi:hypothetical protein